MRKILYFLLLLSVFSETYAQEYDLIVTIRGDSIASKIDSIANDVVYFKMKSTYNWVSTTINRNEVLELKHNAIDMKMFIFKPGTSFIISPRQEPETFRDIQRNSIYAGIFTVNYSRMIPGEHVAFTLAGGVSFIEGGLIVETTMLTGGTKHFFEPGILFYFDSETFWPMIRTGYRYQGPKGFLFRIAPLWGYFDGFSVLPALSIGYSF